MVKKRRFQDLLPKIIVYFIILVLSASMLIPIINIIAKSFSDVTSVTSGKVFLLPVNPQTGSYWYVLSEPIFYSAFRNSIVVTFVGTLSALALTVLTAYPLSRRHIRGRKVLMYLFIFVAVFNGGMVPNYMLYRSLNLLDKLPVLIIPGMFGVFNMLIVKNYFEELPVELEDAAKIDGASNMKILIRIMLPLALPVLATIGLFYAVGYWNDYFTSMLYISNPAKKPLQLYLYESLQKVLTDTTGSTGSVDDNFKLLTKGMSLESVRAATIVVTTLPIIILYPFLQKYFVKGMVIGSVKG